MESRVKETIVRHDKGYNCAQAVAWSYCARFGDKEEDVFRMTEGFGLGMGCMAGTCGALSGAVLLAGLKNSDGQINAPKTKGKTYKLSRQLLERFQERCGSTICAELKGVTTGTPVHSCADCIKDAAAIVEEVLLGGENE